MADELLNCPFCGSQAAWPEPEVNMNYVQCMSCSATANHAGEWNRRTTPTPATDEREAVARALIVAAGAELVASEKHWPETAAQYYTMCEKYQSYAASHGLVTDAFRNADAALSALAPIRAQEIAAARAEEQGYRHTQVAALNQVHAAEILAAEANERARILSDAAIEAAREYLALCGHEPISDIFIEGAIKEAIKAGERNEHGAGK